MIASLPSTVQLSPSVAVTPLVLNCKSPLKGHPWLVIVDAAETSSAPVPLVAPPVPEGKSTLPATFSVCRRRR